MQPPRPRLDRAVSAAARDPRRSPLFHWMLRHHSKLVAELKGPRVDWGPLIASAVKARALTCDGRQPTALNMRRTWRNACAAVAAEKTVPPPQNATVAPSRRHYPRDLPADAKPREAKPTPASGGGSGRFDRPSAFATNGKAIVNAKEPTPDELIEGLRRVLNEASGRR